MGPPQKATDVLSGHASRAKAVKKSPITKRSQSVNGRLERGDAIDPIFIAVDSELDCGELAPGSLFPRPPLSPSLLSYLYRLLHRQTNRVCRRDSAPLAELDFRCMREPTVSTPPCFIDGCGLIGTCHQQRGGVTSVGFPDRGDPPTQVSIATR